MAQIGTRIARRRQQLRMTQEQLAARIGVSKSTVANWETGKHFPKRKLGLVEEALGVTFCDDEPPEPELSPSLLRLIDEELPPEQRQPVIDAIKRTLAGEPGEAPGTARSGRHRRAPG